VGHAADRSKWKVTPKERVQQMLNPVATGGAGSDAPGSLFDPLDLVASLGDLGAMPADSAEATVSKELGSLPLTPEGSLLMFWLDAYEDPVNMPGVLYLFGKVRCYGFDSVCR
jgi:hypothetical protein